MIWNLKGVFNPVLNCAEPCSWPLIFFFFFYGRSDKWSGAWSSVSCVWTGKYCLHGIFSLVWKCFILSLYEHYKWVACVQFPIGFSVAGSVRVGNAMGAGDVAQAKLSARLSMICAGKEQMARCIVLCSLQIGCLSIFLIIYYPFLLILILMRNV